MNNGNSNHSVLDFEVVPENCLRNEFIELALGTPINQVLSALKNASRVIRNVELIYCNKDPFNREITVILKNDGVRLTFDPKQQVLKLIEVYDFRHITLHYCNTVFSTPEKVADVGKVEHCFGATHPGVYDEKQKVYLLHWRGVSFNFPAKEPSTVQPSYAHGLGSLNFSNTAPPLLERMGIYFGDSPTEMKIPDVPASTHCGNPFALHISSVSDDVGTITGLKIQFCGEEFGQSPRKTSELSQKERIISFGDSEQSVLGALGAPSRVFYKSEDKMLIQRGSSSESIGNADKPDIFYNYFTLGLDVLLDSEKRTVIKFILHTNVPGHYDFGEYVRTSFEIQCSAGQGPFAVEPCTIFTNSKLEDFKAAFADPETGIAANPVVVNRAPTNEGENPFGSTFCYGNDQLIVEVLDNGHIATLIVYEPTDVDSKIIDNLSETMVRKQIDNRIRTLIENGITTGHRSMFVVVGEKARDQAVLLHHILTKAVVAARPNVLWCYKKELGFSSHRKKRMREIQKKKSQLGKVDVNEDDPFESFISSTDIRYCYYSETNQIIGNTYGMLILQDFEAVTPNILARTIETVRSGGVILFLLQSVNSLRQLYTMTMDVHSRYRTEAHQDVVGRFCERFILSLSDCKSCVVMNDQLEVLPISSHIVNLEPLPPALKNEMSSAEEELTKLKAEMADIKPIGQMLRLCKTLCQANAVLRLLDLVSERSFKAVASITAARGRGKSAALGLTIAGAISLNFTNISVTSPSPENLKAVFEFLLKGFEALGLKEHADFEIVYSTKNDQRKTIMAINVTRTHRQTIQYIEPDEVMKLNQTELLIIDEAAAIPLPLVKKLISGSYMSFLASTINGYEGTGRSLSLKLLQQLRSQTSGTAQPEQKDDALMSGRKLHEITLEESIRYKSGDQIEKWLYKLLCLDATNAEYKVSGAPPPDRCELYYVNRDTLFSYNKASESFLSRVMSIFVSAHYKNSPDDLQMLSDAPAHHLFVLMSPIKKTQTALPEVLAAVQVCMEGRLTKETVRNTNDRGRRAAGDLIPWTISQHYLDDDFPQLSGARIIRLAVHPQLQDMGYGSRTLQLLQEYYEGQFVSTMTKDESAELVNYFKHGAEVEDELRRTNDLPPLLHRLTERKPEQLDYLGVSYGVNVNLLKFWKRNSFIMTYLRPTKNELTAEHTCIMLKDLKTSGPENLEKRENWVDSYFLEFRRRFVSLLSYEFKDFLPKLALSILQKSLKTEKTVNKGISRRDLELFLTNGDLKRLSKYSRNMANHFLITDILPTIAELYFNGKLESTLELDIIQSAVLLCMGLQRKSADTTATELNLLNNQVMAHFNKAMRKLSDYFDRVCESAIEAEMNGGKAESTIERLKPTSISLEDELKNAEQEIRARQDKDRQNLLTELGLGDVLTGNKTGQLSQFAIKASDEEWAGALKNVKLSNAKTGGIVSIKAAKRSNAPRNLGDDEMADKPQKKKMKKRR
ncbi:RNA cytidine acetyltransferase [Aphelenchoides besseyi]|nr:RNA cytidine acetyltransferase [Aphelenchoides besseyi]